MTTADCTWQTRGWRSKNATLNGALLYYHHLCQKGRDKIVEGGVYLGTSKSAEGYSVTFQRAKEEGMEVAQDADSSSAKAVREIFPEAEIMLCGGHAGRAHRKYLEKRQKFKMLPSAHIEKYKDIIPFICEEEYQNCKCVGLRVSQECLTGSTVTGWMNL